MVMVQCEQGRQAGRLAGRLAGRQISGTQGTRCYQCYKVEQPQPPAPVPYCAVAPHQDFNPVWLVLVDI